MNIEEQKNKTAKHIKVLCLIIGFVYAGYALFSILIVILQQILMSNLGTPKGYQEMSYVHNIMLIFLPLIILLGIAYIVYGFSFKKIKKNAYIIHVVLRILSILLAIGYFITSFYLLPEMTRGLKGKIMIYIFSIFGYIIYIAAFTIPQYFINKKVKRFINLNEPNN